MSEFKDDTFLARWLNDELSDQELEEFKQSEDYKVFNKIKNGAELIKDAKFNSDRILQRIKAETLSTPKETKSRLWIYSAAASVLLILGFFLYTTIFSSNLITYTTGVGEKISVTLPDGSKATLNANSTLTYDEKSWKNKRELTLQGEGYFDVTSGSKFIVHVRSGDVEVLGTQFTIQEIDDFFEVLCFEGSVKVSSGDEVEILKPKQGVRKTRTSQFDRRVLLYSEPRWLEGTTQFASVPMSYVIKELKNQFGVEVQGENLVKEMVFTGSFPHDDLDKALKLVFGSIGDIKYNHEGKKVVLSKN